MSLDFYLMETKRVVVFEKNTTHNHGKIATALGIYKHLWRPEELGIRQAKELVAPLKAAIKELENNPTKYAEHDPANGWGSVESFMIFLDAVCQACFDNPYAEIEVSV